MYNKSFYISRWLLFINPISKKEEYVEITIKLGT
jgi:hypothetical protein